MSPQSTATSTRSASPMQRADELLRQMTIEEKAMQLSCVVPLALLGPDGPAARPHGLQWRRRAALTLIAAVAAVTMNNRAAAQDSASAQAAPSRQFARDPDWLVRQERFADCRDRIGDARLCGKPDVGVAAQVQGPLGWITLEHAAGQLLRVRPAPAE